PLDARACRLGQRGGYQHQDVDVRAGMQLAASVAADRDQAQLPGELTAQLLAPELAEQRVDEAGASVHQGLDRLPLGEARGQLRLRLLQQRAADIAARLAAGA